MAMGSTGPADDYWYQPGGSFYGGVGAKTKAGAPVSETNAMQLSVVWACIKILSEDSASLPLHLYRRLKGGGKERATDHPLYSLMHDQPNSEMTSMTFRQTFASHILSWGNAYAEIQWGKGRVGSSRIVALWPITPNRVKPFRDPQEQIMYRITMPGGVPSVILPKRQVLHVPGLGFDGLFGYSPIGFAKEAIGLGMALEEYSERFFGNGTHPGVVVSHPGKMSQVSHDNLEKALTVAHSGLGQSHRLLLLEEAMKIEKIGIPNKESQFIESKKYSNIEIGTRIYRVPPYMYGEMEKSAWANVEQQAIDYVVQGQRPWLVRYEQGFNTALLSFVEQKEYFFEHLIDGLLRGDMKSRFEAYAIGRQWGWYCADDILEMENRNPLPDGQGKTYLIPLNMIPASEAGKVPQPKQQSSFDHQVAYRARLESAYHRIFADAAERVIRKETKRLKWGMEKHCGNGGFPVFVDEFYREMPDYIQKQMLPAFMSFSEAIMGMETEVNGLKLDGHKVKFERFVNAQMTSYAENYVKNSRSDLLKATELGKFEMKMNQWETDRADEIASNQTVNLADNVIGFLKTITG